MKRLTKEENGWVAMWVGCFECPLDPPCSEEKPCEDCKMARSVWRKL